ncbi:4Fe-4S binding protein [Thermodesulfobacteriota bacterium]
MPEHEMEIVYRTICNKIRDLEESTVLPKILASILTPEQAKLAAELPALPEELASKLGRSLKDIESDLQYFYEIGLGTPSAGSGKWNLPRSFPLLFDKIGSHHKRFIPFLGPEYLDLWPELEKEYEQYRLAQGTPRHPGRIIPAYLAAKDHPEFQPWESVKSIFQMADKIALVDCTCRSKLRHRTCGSHTTELCFLLNRDADYAVDSKAGTYITVDEAVQVCEHCEKLGFVHRVAPKRAVASLLCNCCNDCCSGVKWFQKHGNDPQWQFPSRFLAVVNEDLCIGCGTCAKTCYYDAAKTQKNNGEKSKAMINPKLCMGCGNCVVACPQDAVKLDCVRPEEFVPRGMWTRGAEQRTGSKYEKYLDL